MTDRSRTIGSGTCRSRHAAQRARPRVPDFVEVVRQQIDPADLTVYEGVPSATVARALIDCRGTIMRDRLLDAVTSAKRTGLLRTREVQWVLDAIGHDG